MKSMKKRGILSPACHISFHYTLMIYFSRHPYDMCWARFNKGTTGLLSQIATTRMRCEMAELAPIEYVERRIIQLRGVRVITGSDLAELYGVTTRRLNEQVRRNSDRFPEDFMFELTQQEKDEVVAECDHLSNLRFSSHPPYAFTEHGALMAANVLRST
jgi:hypothetical protein